jgi:hypothetical protein
MRLLISIGSGSGSLAGPCDEVNKCTSGFTKERLFNGVHPVVGPTFEHKSFTTRGTRLHLI